MMFRLATLTIAALLLARAQTPTQAPAPVAPPPDPLDRSTPHGCVFGFLRAAQAGDYERAGEYLDLRRTRLPREETARQLQTVLDRSLPVDLDSLSRAPEGDLNDGLPPGRERLGAIKTEQGKLNIDLERVEQKNGPAIWLFSANTMRAIPDAFAGLEEPGFARFLPRPVAQIRVFSVPLWRWLTAIAGLTVGLALASLISRALVALLQPVLRRLTRGENVRQTTSLRGPVRLLVLAAVIRIPLSHSASLLARQFWLSLARFLVVIGVAWLLMQLSDIVSALNSRRLLRLHKPNKMAMLALARRMFKIAVAVAAGILLLERAGVNVTALLAGLGVGSIAVALAARKTLENVFGGLALIMSEAARVGDVCKIVDQIGTVEDIGLATTRIRTFDRTLVSVPNANLSQATLENFAMRDKNWFHQLFGLRYDTSADQLRTILAGIEEILRGDPIVESSTARVRFMGFGPSSLNLEIFAYVLEPDYAAFLRSQQRLLLAILKVIEDAGAVIASPVLVADPANKGGAGTAKVSAAPAGDDWA